MTAHINNSFTFQ